MRNLLKAVLASVIATGGLAVSGAAFAFPEPYCTRAFTNAVEPITHVALFNIDNTTGAAVGGTPADEDFTAIVGNLHPGSTYAVSMSGNSDGNFTNYYRLYVDWNHDGVFNEDASERYEIGSIVNSTGVDGKSVASPLLIPLDALTGQTRMRAVKKYNDPGAACSGTDASGTSYGQAEDYTVNVDPALIPPPTMTKAFAPTNADASLPSTLTISLGANASATPLTLTADLVDTFPAGMTVATTPNASTSCSAATLTAASGAGSVTLASGAQIPPAGCSISVDVQVAAAAVYVNTIPAGSLQTSGGSYAAAVSATYQATSPGVVNYSSGFESPFTIGGINGQQGWAARSVNVANTTPANGAQHLSITSTASPSTSNYALAISPDQAAGTTAYALISANVRMTRTTNGANWRFNPQDTPAGLVTSILQFERSVVQKIQIAHFAPDGSATLVDTGATWPASTYFNIKLIVERATGALKICKDNVEIYNDPSGDSVAGTDITDVAVSQLSGSGNTAGNTFFADDLVIDNTNIGSCNGLATPAVAKSFAPASVVVDTDSMATITLSNPNAAAITLSADLVDTLPAGLVASAASTTCGGTASFTAGTLTLASGATIPPGSCTLTATVQAATADSYVNTIHAGDLQTGAGTNAADALATLTVTDVVLLAPTVAKSFAPASVAVDTDSTATITLTNPNATAITLSADLVDVLPAGLVASAAATTCGGTASFTAGTLTLAAGATIPAGSSCTLSGTVQAAAAGSDINTIDVGDLQTSAGSNAAAASATLTVTGGGSNGVYHSPQLNHAVVNSTDGTSLNLVLGTFDDTGPISGEWDLNFWASGGALRFWSVSTHSNRLVVSGTTIAALHPGDTVGPSSTFQTSSGSGTPAAEWLAGTNAYAGVKFNCDGRLTHPVPATVCYGYVHITSTGAAGFPATVVEYSYDGDGNAITIPAAALVAPTVAKVFAPASVVVNANSTATITLSNPNAAAITLSADLVDTLPAGLVASAAATTCGGTASFTAGTLTLASGATIPPGSCTLSGTVQAAAAGGYDNTIHAGDLQTNAGNNAADALATLTVTTSVVTHTVTPSVGTPSGSVAPATVQTVNDGATTTFTLTADPGFHIDGVGGTCGGALAGIVYTTAAVTTDCTVVANFAADGGSNGIILSGPLGHAVADSVAGTSLNIVTSAFDDTGPTSGDWDFNFWDNSGFAFYTLAEHSTQYVVDGTGNAVVMQPGDVVGPGSVFSTQTGNGTVTAAAGWLAGTDGYAGVKFDCDGRLTHPVVGTVCYGYVHITTTGTTGFPATIVDTAFDGDGNAITIVGGSTGNDPAATVAPTSLAFTVVADATATDTLNIANAAGSNALTYSIASSGSTAKRPLLVPHVAGLSKGRVGNARPQDADKLRYLEQLRQQPLASFAARGGLSSSRTPAPWSPRAADGAITFVADDGTYETAIGLNNGVATSGAVYVNRFSATDALTVDSISILWPSSSGVTTGMQPNLVVYYDAAATGDITNAVRLGVDQIVSIDSLDAFQTYTTSFSVPGAGDVYIGFVDEWGLVVGGFNGLVSAAALDVDSPSVTYVSGSSDNTLVTDIINLANNDLTGAGSDFGLDGAWLVRATGAAGGGAPCTGPVVSWLTAAPASGSVAGGSNVDVTVTANPAAGGLAAGSYTAELCVTTNDPDQPLISVPVSLTVTPATVLPCSAADTVFCNGFEGASGGGDVVTGTINQAVVQDDNGSSFDFASGDYHGYSPSISSDDINLYFLADPAPPVNPGMIVYWYGDAVPAEFQALVGGVVDGAGQFAVLHSGDTIGPASTVSAASTSMDNWFTGSDGYIGVAFYNEDTAALNFGYLHIATTAPEGFPAQVLDYGYDASGAAITIP